MKRKIKLFCVSKTGKIYWQSSHVDDLDDTLLEDISDSDAYLQIPDKKELGLGKPLALDFAQQFLPNDFDEVFPTLSETVVNRYP